MKIEEGFQLFLIFSFAFQFLSFGLLGRLQMLDIDKAILKRSENRGIQLQQEFLGDC